MRVMRKKWDIGLIAVLLLLSLIPEGIFMATGRQMNTDSTYAVVQVNGETYKTIPLSEHRGTDTFVIQTKEGYNRVVVRDQEIGITEADCPDKICISEGFISKPGEMAVCLPHKVMIEVRSNDSAEPDVIPAH